MTAHETSKVNGIYQGELYWEAHCTCGWERNVRLESEADIDISDHQSAVVRDRQRLARVAEIARAEQASGR